MAGKKVNGEGEKKKIYRDNVVKWSMILEGKMLPLWRTKTIL